MLSKKNSQYFYKMVFYFQVFYVAHAPTHGLGLV